MDPGEWMTGWMNEQIKGEIADLQDRYGFEEQEAVAYWHLRRAEILMVKMRHEDEERWRETEEEEGEEIENGTEWIGVLMARTSQKAARFEGLLGQPFAFLFRQLGARVLRRDYPQGWDREDTSDVPEEWLQPPPEGQG